MHRYRNVSPQGDQIVDGHRIKAGETFATDADLSGNPNFEQVKHTPRKRAGQTEGND